MGYDPAVEDRVAFNRAYKESGGRNGPLGAGYPPEVAARYNGGYGGGYGVPYMGGYGGGINANINLGHGSRLNVGAPLGLLIGAIAGGHHNHDRDEDQGPPRYVPGYGHGSAGFPMRGRPDYAYEGGRSYDPRGYDPLERERRLRETHETRPDLVYRDPVRQPSSQDPVSAPPAATPGATPPAAAPANPPAAAPDAAPAPAGAAPATPAGPDQKTLNQQAQFYLEEMGFDTGTKNHKIGPNMAAGAVSEANRLDGIVGSHTKAALEAAHLDPNKPITAETVAALKAQFEQQQAEKLSHSQPQPAPAAAAPTVPAPTPVATGTAPKAPHLDVDPSVFTTDVAPLKVAARDPSMPGVVASPAPVAPVVTAHAEPAPKAAPAPAAPEAPSQAASAPLGEGLQKAILIRPVGTPLSETVTTVTAGMSFGGSEQSQSTQAPAQAALVDRAQFASTGISGGQNVAETGAPVNGGQKPLVKGMTIA